MSVVHLDRRALLLLWLFMLGIPLSAQGDTRVRSTASAVTVPAGQLQLSLFQLSRYGLTDRVEIATQPLLLPLLPQAELKINWLRRKHFSLGSRLRAAYPPLLLNALSGEGALALLPKDAPIPFSLLLAAEGLATAHLHPAHEITLNVTLTVAPRESYIDTPQLDFPFLYSRFAALWSSGTYLVGLTYEGRLLETLVLCAGLRTFLLPATPGGFSLEPWANVRFLVGEHVGLELGLIVEYARFPAGVQHHLLPFLDATVAF